MYLPNYVSPETLLKYCICPVYRGCVSLYYIPTCIKLELLFQLTPESPINKPFRELCKLISCFLRQSLHHEHLSFFSPHFIAFTTPFSTLFLIFPSSLFTLFHLYGFSLLLCISINNYSFNFYYFMHLHSSNHPLNLYFLLMLIIENCQLRPISQLQFIQNRTQIISDRSLTQI